MNEEITPEQKFLIEHNLRDACIGIDSSKDVVVVDPGPIYVSHVMRAWANNKTGKLEKCKWEYNGEFFDTECEENFYFDCDVEKYLCVKFKFCPFCGNEIEEGKNEN